MADLEEATIENLDCWFFQVQCKDEVAIFNLYSQISHVLRAIHHKFQIENEVSLDLIHPDGSFTNLSKKPGNEWLHSILQPREVYILARIREDERWKSKLCWEPYIDSLDLYPNIKERLEMELMPESSLKQKRDKRGRLITSKPNDG